MWSHVHGRGTREIRFVYFLLHNNHIGHVHEFRIWTKQSIEFCLSNDLHE